MTDNTAKWKESSNYLENNAQHKKCSGRTVHIVVILQYQKLIPCEFLTDVFFVLDAFLKFGTHQLQKKEQSKIKALQETTQTLIG